MRDGTPEALRRGFAAADPGERPGQACPGPAAIWDAVRAASPVEERRRIVEHIAGCSCCAADWRLAMGSEAAAVTIRSPRPGLRPLLVAAAVLLAVALAVVLRIAIPEEGEPVYRASGATTIRSLLDEGDPLAREAFVLRWSALGEGTRYTFHLTDRRLRLLVAAEALTEPEFRVPEADLLPLASGDLVLWQVEAVHLDGRRILSETFTTRLE